MMRKSMDCLKKIMGASRERKVTMVREKKGEATGVLQPACALRLRPEPAEQVPAEIVQTIERQGAPPGIQWGGLTDIGKIRDHNEDSFSLLSLVEKSLIAVADGMGGHDAGETASMMAVETLCREVSEGVEKGLDPQRLVEYSVHEANRAVKQEGARKNSNMGTTLCAALIVDDTAHIANVGDSRAYWIENGYISQITEDHSLVAKLVADGMLTKEEARNHPQSNMLYRSVGNDEMIKVDTFQVALKKGGSLLLCTDGLWGEVSDEEIRKVFAAGCDAKTSCATLVRMANENGGKDNITAVVVSCR